jgi:L-lactate dehydrogenase complex protein LldG
VAATSAREEILGKISRALESQAQSGSPVVSPRRTASDDARLTLEIRSRCERERDVLIEQFESEVVEVGGRVFHAATTEDAAGYIEQIALSRDAKAVIASEAEVVEKIGLKKRLDRFGISYSTEVSDTEFRRTAIEAAIGVSGVDYALADTGTLVLLASRGQARSISLLPPIHIAIVESHQIVPGLTELFQLLRLESADETLGSAVTFITGPSRTADIELTLVVGVHGPQELHVILLKN